MLFRYLALFAAIAACLALSACTEGYTPEIYKGEPALRVIPYFSPEHAPQRKKSPGDIPTLESLWQPLNKVEASGPVRRREAETITALSMAFKLNTWLPTGERTVLHGYIYRLRGQQRYVAAQALERATKYLPLVKDGLMSYGLPAELTAFPLLLSTYEPHGISACRAGLWQMTPKVAVSYGLKVNGGLDERLDVIKSTGAAARRLIDLYSRFSDWKMVLMAYVEGEDEIRRAIITAEAHNYEELAEFCRNNRNHKYALSENTLQSVPKFVAALLALANTKDLGLGAQDILSISRQAELDTGEPSFFIPARKNNPNSDWVNLPIQ